MAVEQLGFFAGCHNAQCFLTRPAICRSSVSTSWAIEVTDFAHGGLFGSLTAPALDRLRAQPAAHLANRR